MLRQKFHSRRLHHAAILKDKRRIYGKLIKNHKWLFTKLKRNLPFYLFGFECGEGWYGIIKELIEGIERVADKELDSWMRKHIRVVQVKEKFGTLRFYLNLTYATDALEELIRDAEEKSAITCEICGKLGKLCKIRGGYLKTLCVDCYKKNEIMKNKPEVFHSRVSFDDIMIDERAIYKELEKLQDQYLRDYPDDTQKQQDAYKEIAEQLGITESAVRKAAVISAKKELKR